MVPPLKSMDVQCSCVYSDALLEFDDYIVIKLQIRQNVKEKIEIINLKAYKNLKIDTLKPFLLK